MVAGGMAVRLMAYRTYLLSISLFFLAAGFYFSYKRRTVPRWNRILLWVVTVLTGLIWSSQYLLRMGIRR